jgi:molybdopterin converting factor small subunit
MAQVKIKIPAPLRPFADDQKMIDCEANNIGELLTALTDLYPALTKNILTDKGEVRHFVNIFVDNEEIKQLAGFETPLVDDQVVAIIPAVSGGQHE